MQAIQTKYMGPTDTKGSRVQVTCAGQTRYFGWDHALGSCDNHIKAAEVFAKEWAASFKLHSAILKAGVYVHIATDVETLKR
ncbi:hypothetical protein X917_gp02 [Pseudomonas phage PPpW-4]|uniref:Uncharacterized protein n=1 Tax=Pseudomonas phage PPpW-4 TaxID=1279083 RepID=V5YTM1_9CAUD|nr:hypothetical protein X917_gp02 [Pseudomonas phage PPpW-4]BAO20668.1 hypothetical protein [Pseudomonas phage PPpW-4]